MTLVQDTDFKFIARLEGAKLKAEDKARHDRAMAGVETGDGNSHDKQRRKQIESIKKAQRGDALSALDIAMMDADYAQVFKDLDYFLRNAASRVETVLEAARDLLDRARDHLDDIIDGASKLPDGTAVFRAANGDVFDANGRKIGHAEAETIVWLSNAPAYEDYVEGRDRVTAHTDRVNGLEGLQSDIADAQDRMDDPENPPSRDEMNDIRDDIDDQLESTKALTPEPLDVQSSGTILTTSIERPAIG